MVNFVDRLTIHSKSYFFFFLNSQPHVDFGLKLLGADAMAIPGLYRFVQVLYYWFLSLFHFIVFTIPYLLFFFIIAENEILLLFLIGFFLCYEKLQILGYSYIDISCSFVKLFSSGAYQRSSCKYVPMAKNT